VRVYYAHCLALYDTLQEGRDVATLEALGFEVVNPNCESAQIACDVIRDEHGAREVGVAGKRIMYEIFKAMVLECDAVAFRATPDGAITSGVVKEIGWAVERGKPVFELPRGLRRRALSLDLTREYLAEIGER
jgi:nucleoside 2-deoxyribosyltransferase